MTESTRPHRVLALLLCVLLQACGPGTGGTGLPPASTSAPASNTTGGTTDGPPPSSSTGTTTVAPPSSSATTAPLSSAPDRAPDLAGVIERLDDTTVLLAGVVLPRGEVDLIGAPLRVGATARAWREGGRWVVRVDG
jgi:hypothetical protein